MMSCRSVVTGGKRRLRLSQQYAALEMTFLDTYCWINKETQLEDLGSQNSNNVTYTHKSNTHAS